MAGIDGTGDYDYEHITPPNEEEMIQIKQRRAKYDEISKRMSQYLLKGYKMLDSYCDVCSNILMEERDGVKYCICCMEIEKRPDVTSDEPSVYKEASISRTAENKRKFKRGTAPTAKTANTEGSLPNSVVLLDSDDADQHIGQFAEALNVVSRKFVHVTGVLEASKSLSEIEDAARCLKVLAETVKLLKSCDQ